MIGTPGDFLPDEKVTKESPRGGHPLWVLPLGGYYHPPNGNAAKRRSRSPQKDSPIEQEVRRQFNLPSAPEDAGSLFYSQPIPLGQEPGESKGVLPLVPGGQGPGGPW